MTGPMTSATEVPSRSRRRWRWRWVFGLRALMVLVLLIGGGLGWCLQQARERRADLATIAAGGGQVVFRDTDARETGWRVRLYHRTGFGFVREVQGVSLDDEAIPPGPIPRSVRRDAAFAAIGRLGRVDFVFVQNGPVTPAHLAALATTRLTRLVLVTVPEVSAAVLAEVARLSTLTDLRLTRPQVKLPLAAVRAAAALTRLEHLDLHGFARLEPADLAPLRRLDRLQSLAISPAPTDEAVLDLLAGMPAMTSLELFRTQVTDAALRRLVAAMPHLEHLAVDGSRLTDAGIEALATLPNLKEMVVTSRCRAEIGSLGRLTDRSLVALGRCRRLSALMLHGGRFTDAGLGALQGLPLRTLVVGSITTVSPPTLARVVTGPSWNLLGLHGPGITDASLPTLAAVVNPATCLDLQDAAITDAGAAQLATLPVRALWRGGR